MLTHTSAGTGAWGSRVLVAFVVHMSLVVAMMVAVFVFSNIEPTIWTDDEESQLGISSDYVAPAERTVANTGSHGSRARRDRYPAWPGRGSVAPGSSDGRGARKLPKPTAPGEWCTTCAKQQTAAARRVPMQPMVLILVPRRGQAVRKEFICTSEVVSYWSSFS